MKKLLLSLLLSSVITVVVKAQIIDDFTDLNFTSAPAWTGSTTEWEVIANSTAAAGATNSNTLKLLAPAVSGTSYLSTQKTDSWGTEQSWGIWIGRRSQAATAANVTYIWLYASEANITSATVDGYRLRFGDDVAGGDKIFLEKITNGAATTVVASTGSVTNAITDFGFQIRVTRSTSNTWTLYTSTLPTTTGSGAIASDPLTAALVTVNQGTASDNTYTDFSNGYFSIAALHSTSANAITALEVDNFKFNTSETATLPVSLVSFTGKLNGSAIDLSWATASEQNNKEFNLFRSGDGNNFTKITTVTGSGTTSEAKNYAYSDTQPLPGINYYKLVQIDNDGATTEFKDIVAVKSNATASNFKIVSNKGNNTVDLTIFAATEGNSPFVVYDLSGRKTINTSLKLNKGYNNISLPLQSNAEGLQIASLTIGTEVITNKFIR